MSEGLTLKEQCWERLLQESLWESGPIACRHEKPVFQILAWCLNYPAAFYELLVMCGMVEIPEERDYLRKPIHKSPLEWDKERTVRVIEALVDALTSE